MKEGLLDHLGERGVEAEVIEVCVLWFLAVESLTMFAFQSSIALLKGVKVDVNR